jgi:hypothetical protein
MPWKTWRETQQEERNAWTWREAVSEALYYLATGLALIVGVVGAVLVLTVGIGFLADWLVGG